jgi:transposase
MDRAVLEKMLGERMSLAEIGARTGRHESTVAYWLSCYGLEASGRRRHAAKGGLTRAELASLVDEGMSISQIADALDRSKTTVRHWLREYELKTIWTSRREASGERRAEMVLSCAQHGVTAFRLGSGGYRCAKCGREAVVRRRRKVKAILVDEAGGECSICGYSRCVAALVFHHVSPRDKRFSISERGVARSLARAREEASKCVLLCANCHAEVEAGVAVLAA